MTRKERGSDILGRMRSRNYGHTSTSNRASNNPNPIYYQGRENEDPRYPIEVAMDNLMIWHIPGMALASGFGLAALASYMTMVVLYSGTRYGIHLYRIKK